jgi:hypothetical protein
MTMTTISETRNDHYGEWLDVYDELWQGSVNLGEVSLGVKIKDGQLYEMDDAAHFYRDLDPNWSPVVSAPTEEVAALFKDLTGEDYPVLTDEQFDRIIELKVLKGYKYVDEAFIKEG